MPLLLPLDFEGFSEQQSDTLAAIVAAIQAWSASPLGLSLPIMRAYTIANQSIANGSDPAFIVWTKTDRVLALGDINLGINTGIALDTTNGRVTLTRGRYFLLTSIVFAANATGFRYVSIQQFQPNAIGVGGFGEISLVQVPASSAGNQIIIQCSCIVDVPDQPTPYQYGVGVFQDSGAPLNVLSDYLNTWFQVAKIG